MRRMTGCEPENHAATVERVSSFLIRWNSVFEVDDDHVGAACECLIESRGAVARDKQVRAMTCAAHHRTHYEWRCADSVDHASIAIFDYADDAVLSQVGRRCCLSAGGLLAQLVD